MTVAVGLGVPTYGAFPGDPWGFLAALAALADSGGVDTFWVPDHVTLPEDDVRANGGRTRVDEPLDLLARTAAKEFLEDATRAHGVWGSPEECLRKLRPYLEVGVDHVILDIRPPEHALDSAERICRQLIPLLHAEVP